MKINLTIYFFLSFHSGIHMAYWGLMHFKNSLLPKQMDSETRQIMNIEQCKLKYLDDAYYNWMSFIDTTNLTLKSQCSLANNGQTGRFKLICIL